MRKEGERNGARKDGLDGYLAFSIVYLLLYVYCLFRMVEIAWLEGVHFRE